MTSHWPLLLAVTACAMTSGCLRDDRACGLDDDCRGGEICVERLCVVGARGDADASPGVDADASRPLDASDSPDGGDAGADTGDVGPDVPWRVLDEDTNVAATHAVILNSRRVVVAYVVDVPAREEVELRVVSRSISGRWSAPEVIASFSSPPNDLLVGEDGQGEVKLLYATNRGDLLLFEETGDGTWEQSVALEVPADTSGACEVLDARSSSWVGGVGCLRASLEADSVSIRYVAGVVDVLADTPGFERVAPDHDMDDGQSFAGSLEFMNQEGGGHILLYRSALDTIEELERGQGGAWSEPTVAASIAEDELYTNIGTYTEAAPGPDGEFWFGYTLTGDPGITHATIRVESLHASPPVVIDYPRGGARTSTYPSVDVNDEGFVFVTYRSAEPGDDQGTLRMSVHRNGATSDEEIDPDIGNATYSSVIADEQLSGVHVFYHAALGDREELRYLRWPPDAR